MAQLPIRHFAPRMGGSGSSPNPTDEKQAFDEYMQKKKKESDELINMPEEYHKQVSEYKQVISRKEANEKLNKHQNTN